MPKIEKADLVKEQKVVKQVLENAWLGISDNDIPSDELIDKINELHPRTYEEEEDPLTLLVRIIRNPDNFYFTCKHILNVELLPFQVCLLQELWKRKYPMLVATRGFGKSYLLAVYSILRALLNPGSKIIIVGAAFRQSKIIFDYAEKIWKNAPILRDIVGNDPKDGPHSSNDRCIFRIGESQITALPLGDGCLAGDSLVTYEDGIHTIKEREVLNINSYQRDTKVWGNGEFSYSNFFYSNGYQPTKKIVTTKGYEIEGTVDHKLRVLENGKIVWKHIGKIRPGQYILIDRTNRWFPKTNDVTTDEAYQLGLFLAHGSVVNDKINLFEYHTDIISRFKLGKFSRVNKKKRFFAREYSLEKSREWLTKWGFDLTENNSEMGTQPLPAYILSASKEAMASCISGIYDIAGTVEYMRAYKDRGIKLNILLDLRSEELSKQIQYILLHYGIISRRFAKKQKEKVFWRLVISGQDVIKFSNNFSFSVQEKKERLEKFTKMKSIFTCIEEVKNIRELVLDVIYDTEFDPDYPINTINRKKVFTIYWLTNFVKRFHFCEHPSLSLLKNIVNEDVYFAQIKDVIESEAHTYDITVPETLEYCANGFYSHNTKIRGQRATDIICDEFASVVAGSEEVFETTITGFGIVSQNPVEQVKYYARIEKLKELGLWDEESQSELDNSDIGNRIVITGTAYYGFNPFCKYWKNYKSYINSAGDIDKIRQLQIGDIDDFNANDYSVIRIPVDMLPKGFMDPGYLARQKATITESTYNMEYGACFITDSDGFFKRSLIESCVTNQPIIMEDGSSVQFRADIRGNAKMGYVYGIDPASERDNFCITIVELRENHRRLVYCWTIKRSDMKSKLKDAAGEIKEQDFYGYVARKIRNLMKVFPCVRIMLDSQGGGVGVEEALQDRNRLVDNEQPIWRVIDDQKPQETDNYRGIHILEMVNFASAEWVSQANHGLKKDMETKSLLFPYFDTVTLGLAVKEDEKSSRNNDTIEDCMLEIEELKDELATIMHTQTSISGRDRWDTPETKIPGTKKGRMRKDRYSALIMANMGARQMQGYKEEVPYTPVGGFASSYEGKGGGRVGSNHGKLYIGNDWFSEGTAGINYTGS